MTDITEGSKAPAFDMPADGGGRAILSGPTVLYFYPKADTPGCTNEAKDFTAHAEAFAKAIRAHWRIENQLHWTLDVTFAEDQSRLRRGHGARNMAVVRHFAINLVRHADEALRPPRSGLRRKTNKPPAPKTTPIKRRRKIASWNPDYLAAILGAKTR